MAISEIYERMYAVVAKVPPGCVVTYGQVAELAGYPGAARAAGAAMRLVDEGREIPWHRVIGKAGPHLGKIAILDPVGGAVQRQLLEAEGVVVDDGRRVDLRKFGWLWC